MVVYENAARGYDWLAMTDRQVREWVRIRLKDLRAGTQLNKKPFAKKAKISERHINKLENGDSSPTVEMLNNWLQACNTDLARFFAELLDEDGRRILNENRRAHRALDRALANPDAAPAVRDFMALWNAGPPLLGPKGDDVDS